MPCEPHALDSPHLLHGTGHGQDPAKPRIAYVCGECGAEYSKWQGQCGECSAWNTLSQIVLESASEAAKSPASRRSGWAGKAAAPKITALKDVQQSEHTRVSTGIGEFDRVLGGGLFGGVGRQAVSSGMSFASTYALGHVANQYYAGGRTLSTQMLKSTYEHIMQDGRALQSQYAPQMQDMARNLNTAKIMDMVRGR